MAYTIIITHPMIVPSPNSSVTDASADCTGGWKEFTASQHKKSRCRARVSLSSTEHRLTKCPGNMLDNLSTFISMRTVSTDPNLKSECWKGAKYLYAILQKIGAEVKLVQAKDKESKSPSSSVDWVAIRTINGYDLRTLRCRPRESERSLGYRSLRFDWKLTLSGFMDDVLQIDTEEEKLFYFDMNAYKTSKGVRDLKANNGSDFCRKRVKLTTKQIEVLHTTTEGFKTRRRASRQPRHSSEGTNPLNKSESRRRRDISSLATTAPHYTLPTETADSVDFVTNMPGVTPALLFTYNSEHPPHTLRNLRTIPLGQLIQPLATQAIFGALRRSFSPGDLNLFQYIYGVFLHPIDWIVGRNSPSTCRQKADDCIEPSLDPICLPTWCTLNSDTVSPPLPPRSLPGVSAAYRRSNNTGDAPEMVNGCYHQRGHSWSLGIVLWSMLQSDLTQYDRMVILKGMDRSHSVGTADQRHQKEGEVPEMKLENMPERASSIIGQCLRREDDIRISIKELTKRLQKAHLDGSIREEHHATPSLQDQNVYS
ncbi:hypothetical protein PROFUN_04259 [Planoprotostelium fungivorum]|uniref:Protein kinase domain-containing protein n=1 Tax=Planoprotostelium fungivorum TaxID=1890364 RepID=A0A2P6NUZ5_9EUKA|nr:hypothetical protein PROFUN_04259 [Planoprotostelium fungivorum]